MVTKIFVIFDEMIQYLNLYYHISSFEGMAVVANKPHPSYDAAPRGPLLKLQEIAPV